MKKSLLLLLYFSLSILLVGCNAEKDSNDISLEKAQKIEIALSKSSEEVLSVITDQQEIEEFVTSLQVDEWQMADIPSDAKPDKIFKLYQADTIKYGESQSASEDVNKIASITTFENSEWIRLRTPSLTLSFKVPKEAAKYLSKQ